MKELRALGIDEVTSGLFAGEWRAGSGEVVASIDPSTGAPLACVQTASIAEYDAAVDVASRAFAQWRRVPAPARGLAVRAIGEALRAKKAELGALIARETGKIRAEAEGEVQEMIDIAD